MAQERSNYISSATNFIGSVPFIKHKFSAATTPTQRAF